MGGKELGGYGCAYGIGVTLSQRTRCVLNASCGVEFGVTGSGRTPLAQICQFFQRVFAGKAKLGVQHGGHVSGVKIKTVATYPQRVFGVVFEILAIEHIDKVCSSHCASGVSAFCFFYCTNCQNADIVGRMVKGLDIVHRFLELFYFGYKFTQIISSNKIFQIQICAKAYFLI